MSTLCERTPDLTVIVPVYNLENYIKPLLITLKAQELGDYKVEYIFVLNNCTDNSKAVIQDSNLPCTIINCKIQGCGPARNAGLDIANGTYIWMMDGDDWLLTEKAIKEVLDKAYAEDLNILRIRYTSDTYQYQYFSMVWQYLLRREFIDGVRFPDFQPGEDDAFMANVLAKAGHTRSTYMRLPRTSQPLYFYNYGRDGSNMMRYYAGEKI